MELSYTIIRGIFMDKLNFINKNLRSGYKAKDGVREGVTYLKRCQLDIFDNSSNGDVSL